MEQVAISAGAQTGQVLEWMSNPITQMLLAPLLGCLVICCLPRTSRQAIRIVALVFSLLSLAAALLMLVGAPEGLRETGLLLGAKEWYPLAQYITFSPDPSVGMQFTQQFQWMSVRFGELQSFGVDYNVGVDGLSLPLILLSAVILVMVVLWAWPRTERTREFFALTLFMQVGILGSFVALDYVLLYLFWEWMLIPMFFLMSGWGKDREKASRAAMKFFIYTLVGSVFMLIGFIALQVWSQGQVYSYSIMQMIAFSLSDGVNAMPIGVRLLIFVALLLGFAVKAPMWPFHTWLPDAHSEAPTEMSVILAALMLKTGTYCYLRVLYATFPDIGYHLGPVIAFCGVVGIVYGAALTLQQTDLKRMVAYSSISHMGFIILGISAMHPNGTAGAMFHMVGHGIIIALLFFLVGWIEERFGTRDMRELAGLSRLAPTASLMLTLAAFAGMGFPGLVAFWGELLTLQGTYANNPGWFTVVVPTFDQLMHFWGSVFTNMDRFMDNYLWYSPAVQPGLSGARFLMYCAAVAVLGILTSAVYMINMLMRIVFSAPKDAEMVPAAEVRPAELALAAAGGGNATLMVESGSATMPRESGDTPPVSRTRAARQPLQLFGLQWNYSLVLLPLALAVVFFGVHPQPLLRLMLGWAEVLSQSQWSIG